MDREGEDRLAGYIIINFKQQSQINKLGFRNDLFAPTSISRDIAEGLILHLSQTKDRGFDCSRKHVKKCGCAKALLRNK